MGTGIDADPATWVRNKLGTDDLWNYGNVANLLNSEILNGVEEHFQSFDVKIKLKFLLSFLQIPRRNIESLSDDLSRIIQLAEIDGDDWVKVVASMLKDYPKTALVNFNLATDSNTFKQTVEDIGISVENCTGTSTLPMECPYLNRTALNHLVGQQQGPTKHFTLRRKPKSAALRAQLTQRASEMASHKKSVGGSGGTSHHAGQKRPLSTGSAPREGSKALTASPAKASTTRSTPVMPPVRSSLRATGASLKKTKLLDITEQPIAGREAKKKKKAQEAEAAAAEAKLNKAAEQQQQPSSQQQQEDAKREDTGDTAKEAEPKTQEPQEEKETAGNEPQEPSVPVTTPSYAVLPGAAPQPSYAPPVPTNAAEDRSGLLRIDPNATTASKNLQRELQIRVRQQQLQLQQQQQQQQSQQPQQQSSQQQNQPQAGTEGQQPTLFRQVPTTAPELNPPLRTDQMTRPEISVPSSLNPFGHAGAHLKHYRVQGAPAQPLTTPTNPAPAPQQPATPPVAPRPTLGNKKGLSLTREQMLAAQEMFRSANKVTRAEKALILGFMAGARENPFPQQGPVITIKLSEEKANMPQTDGSSQTVLVEMLFEMNYDTGHWRRLKRTRVLAPAAAEDAAAPSY